MDRGALERAYWDAVRACDPEVAVRARLAEGFAPHPRRVFGIAVGKAAVAMARGAGPVDRGVCVTHTLAGLASQPLPAGWAVLESSHPTPDARATVAADAVCDLVACAGAQDRVLALISGGASAMIERPVTGLSLAQFVAEVEAVVRSGVPIQAINAARTARSQLKGGGLTAHSRAPVLTLVVSDVVDDDVRIVGSGLTCGPVRRPQDHAEVVSPMNGFGRALYAILRTEHPALGFMAAPLTSDTAACAHEIYDRRPVLGWGEPTVALPDRAGVGGRAQHLALHLAVAIRGRGYTALVAGSDGMDGPPPRDRPAPAGAIVDSGTHDAIVAAGIDPLAALARADAGTALAAAGALFVTGPTGINAGDVMLLSPMSRRA